MKKVFASLIVLSCASSLMVSLPVSAESISTTFPVSRSTEETIATTLDPEQDATASTSAATTTTTTTMTTETEPVEDDDHEFIVNVMDEFSLFEMLNLDTTVRFVQFNDNGEEIAEIARWNPAEENPYRISHELLVEDAVYSLVIDELPEGYSYTYLHKPSVKHGEYQLSELESGDVELYLYIRDEPAVEQIQLPASGTIPISILIGEHQTYEVIENVDATLALLDENGTVQGILGAWNTSETPVFTCELPYYFETEQDRICVGVLVENLPEEYVNHYPEGYIPNYLHFSDLYSMEKYGWDAKDMGFYFKKKNKEYTYTSTNPEESKETTTTTTTTVTKQTGDVNGDGNINILDVIKINRAVLGKEVLTEAEQSAADVNADQKVDASDSLAILKYLVGIIDSFEVQEEAVPVLMIDDYRIIESDTGWSSAQLLSVIDTKGIKYTVTDAEIADYDLNDQIQFIMENGKQSVFIQDADLNTISEFTQSAGQYQNSAMINWNFSIEDYGEEELFALYTDENDNFDAVQLCSFGGLCSWLEDEEVQDFVTMMIQNGYYGDPWMFTAFLEGT